MSKKMRAILYVVGGLCAMFGALAFATFMYFSATFLPGMHIARYTLYAVMAGIYFLASWFVYEGFGYLNRQRKKKRRW